MLKPYEFYLGRWIGMRINALPSDEGITKADRE